MPPKRIFTPQETRILVKGLEARKNTADIAKRLKVSPATIVKNAKRLGYELTGGNPKTFEWTPEREKLLVELWMSGVRPPYIAKVLKTSVPIITNKANELEMPKQDAVISLAGMTAPTRHICTAKQDRRLFCHATKQTGERCANLRVGNSAFCRDCQDFTVPATGYRSSANYDNGAAMLNVPRRNRDF